MKGDENRCIFYKSLVDGRMKIINFEDEISGEAIYERIAESEAFGERFFKITRNGRLMKNTDLISKQNAFVSLFIPVFGGKGGFGSMLRAIGAQIEKTTNKEACRDLSGRRLRDINAEKRIKEWIAKQATKKEEEERKKLEKLEKLRQEPKIEFKDDDYFKSREEIPDKIDNAVEYGLKMESLASKEKTTDSIANKKPVKSSDRLWIGVDIDDDDDDDEDEVEAEEESSNSTDSDKRAEKSVESASCSTAKRKLDDEEASTSKRICTL